MPKKNPKKAKTIPRVNTKDKKATAKRQNKDPR
jgi:hypothetical protein